ncbi:hypothetical protein [Sphingobacterium faecium]|uniref:hypothetical protein n=1 Tax=Sphingobacterium faecium TaxID=34087 RepID=UPI00246941C6|nr:hypothetical protein [Sphingobacterium faecium]MDH5827331.1 hypothetical protein [Sphingobacterium faecium]
MMNRSAIGHGTVGGLLLGAYPALIMGDILKTILLAAIGATVSFCVSLLLGSLTKRKK